MSSILVALAWQLLAIPLMALLYFTSIAFHATAILNVRSQLLMSAGRQLTPRILGMAFIASSVAVQVLAVASFVSPVSRATPTGAAMLVIASGVALGRITWRSWRAIAPAYRELTWLKRYGVGAEEVMCFARRQVYSELVLEASFLTPFLGALVGMASAANVGPEHAVPVFVASAGGGMFIAYRAFDLHARHYAKLIFLRGVARFWP
ncbi:hypothetical protein AB0L64_10285 [Kribbella sp. NPDC051936]|uniref:hypothetical protein n=1 Tax=Kribbella sp. NPDC051936 TaxID=3154946 RepID=UPI00341946C8